MHAAVVIFLGILCAPFATLAQPHPQELEDLITQSLRSHQSILEQQVEIAELEAKVQEIRSIFLPKISALMWISPMYTVEGTALDAQVTTKYKNIRDWGPYTHIEANLVQPIYTFGRGESGKKAAQAQVNIGEAKLAAVRNSVRHDVATLYYSLLYARSLDKPLQQAREWLSEAQELARKSYEKGDGTVTQSDLQKLNYGSAKIKLLSVQRSSGEQDAMDGLRHALGLGFEQDLEVAQTRLPRPQFSLTETTLSQWLVRASENRPEWSQLQSGENAAIAFNDAQRLSSAPVLFLGAQITHDWAPTRTDAQNPYHFDQFNNLFGGVALGLQFDVDLGKDKASRMQGEATLKRVENLRKFAESGIPLQVARAHRRLQETQVTFAAAKEGKKSTQKWLTFALSAYRTGTGDARDLMEALVAYLESRQLYYNANLQWLLAVNGLYLATGDAAIVQGDQ